jgi:hypothetical protein
MRQLLYLQRAAMNEVGKQVAKELTSLATCRVVLAEDWLLLESASHAARAAEGPAPTIPAVRLLAMLGCPYIAAGRHFPLSEGGLIVIC